MWSNAVAEHFISHLSFVVDSLVNVFLLDRQYKEVKSVVAWCAVVAGYLAQGRVLGRSLGMVAPVIR